MTPLLRLSLSSAAIALLAPAAFADLTADDVWSDMQSYLAGFGYDVAAQEARSDDRLTLSGVTVSSGAAATLDATLTMDQIVLIEQPDGSVAIDLPVLMPVQAAIADTRGVMTRFSMDFRQSGLTLVASGSPDDMQYQYTADQMALQSTGVEIDGTLQPADLNAFDVEVADLSGTTTMIEGEMRSYAQDLAVGSVKYNLKAGEQRSSDRAEIAGQLQAVTFTGRSDVPLNTDRSDPLALMAAGMTTDGTFEYAAQAAVVSITNASGPSTFSILSGAGRYATTLDSAGLTYATQQSDTQVEMAMNVMPFPITLEVANSAANITVPLGAPGTTGDFALGLSLDGLKMPDMLWSFFDPQGQLPRDAARIEIDLNGKGELPAALLAPMGGMQTASALNDGKIEALDINKLNISAMGADLSGTGAFAFETAQGAAPRPDGAMDLILTGGNSLLDRLVAIGVLPAQQAQAARMMMAVLAVPGDGPDTLQSRIEVTPQGHVLANGQRIR